MEERQVPLADGRTLRVADSQHDAPVVLFHHGTPGGVRTGQALAARAGGRLRIVSYDRAGYGRSAPHRGRSVRDVAEDITVVADALGLGRFATWGWSGGGPHALATAALLGDRVTACATWASVMPGDADVDFLAGMAEANVEEFAAALAGRAALEADIEPAAASIAAMAVDEAVDGMEPYCSPGDMAALRRATDVVIVPMVEALQAGAEGWIDDDLAFVRSWDVQLETITAPVALWQGREDLMVPPGHAEWLAAHLPGATLHLTPTDGHITLIETALDATVEFLTRS